MYVIAKAAPAEPLDLVGPFTSRELAQRYMDKYMADLGEDYCNFYKLQAPKLACGSVQDLLIDAANQLDGAAEVLNDADMGEDLRHHATACRHAAGWLDPEPAHTPKAADAVVGSDHGVTHNLLQTAADRLDEAASFLTDDVVLPCEAAQSLADSLAGWATACRYHNPEATVKFVTDPVREALQNLVAAIEGEHGESLYGVNSAVDPKGYAVYSAAKQALGQSGDSEAEQALPTPTPWEVDSDPAVITAEAADNPLNFVAMVLPAPSLGWNLSREAEANAKHIVACVNACAGINPETVPKLVDALRMAEGALDSLKDQHPVRALHEYIHGLLKEARQDG